MYKIMFTGASPFKGLKQAVRDSEQVATLSCTRFESTGPNTSYNIRLVFSE